IRNLGVNGHPRAYYIMVWLLQHISKTPLTLSLVNFAFALAATLLFLRSAPVTRFQAALFSVGFYPLYQYGIISRSYSLLLFLLFLYCHLRSTRPSRLGLRSLVLAALAQVHLISMFVAGALLIFEFVTLPASSRWRAKNWALAAVVILSMVATAWQMA